MIGSIIAYGTLFGAALGLALAIIVFGALALHFGQRVRNEPLPLAFFGIAAAFMIAPLAMQRVLSAGLAGTEASAEEISSSFWFSRVATVFVLALCAERIARYLIRPADRPALRGWSLLWAFFAFAAASQVINGMLGTKPSFDHKWLYAFPVYFAFFVVAQQQSERCFAFARWALLAFLIGSALAVLVRPTAVLEFGSPSSLPGFSFRYYGLATHANTMGPMSIAAMIVLWAFPFRNRWVNYLSWGLAASSLILSQSKTSIAVALAVLLFLGVFHYRLELGRSRPEKAPGFALALWGMICLALAFAAAGLMTGLNYVDWVIGKLDTITGGQWASLSGRTRIWALAWSEFLNSPLFGYGPRIWDPIYRFYVQMPFATHAHNQVLQSLSAGGALAGITLLLYASVLGYFAIRSARITRGASVALVFLMYARSVSEVPFATASVMQPEFLVHLVTVIACLAGVRTNDASLPQLSDARTRSDQDDLVVALRTRS